MRIWIAGGGTGGHVYPGLAVLQDLRAGGPVEPLYVGGIDSVEERLAERAGLRFVGVHAGGVHGLAPHIVARNLVKLARGFGDALRLGRRERPQALFVTGGYASVPVAMAAWVLRVPILVYLPDIEPGLAVRFIARLARRVAVTTEASRAYFPARKVVVTGYPVRPALRSVEREAGRRAFGLPPDATVVLIFGGSHGARSINQAVVQNLEAVLQEAEVIHVSGELDWVWVAERAAQLPADLRARYHSFPYLHEEMGAALAAADLAVCRAGASALGELPVFGLPAVLVPYPHAWRYQRVNAQWLVERGAAVMLEDERLGAALLDVLRELLVDRARLAQMSERAREQSRPDAAARLAAELRAIARPGAEEAS
ncbi:MAG: undecaprenyldiphospho-muramoylpentapeptide beta-N-acetylglucosaminyltransferase [Anaerolineae bacterium]|nr:undecaprenyldiphospho-muramoylpentapeptide beta-N-acetylglucosaminyltransferase [Anaerolineae bacterium]